MSSKVFTKFYTQKVSNRIEEAIKVSTKIYVCGSTATKYPFSYDRNTQVVTPENTSSSYYVSRVGKIFGLDQLSIEDFSGRVRDHLHEWLEFLVVSDQIIDG